MTNETESKLPWYNEGLGFNCTGCGGCCTGFPGFVWVNDQEIKAFASHFKISPQRFSDQYLRKVDDRFSLRESPVNYDCVFLDGKRCTVYNLRPSQCRTFPFWPQNIASPEAWAETARHCEGISAYDPDTQPLTPREIIEKNAYPRP